MNCGCYRAIIAAAQLMRGGRVHTSASSEALIIVWQTDLPHYGKNLLFSGRMDPRGADHEGLGQADHHAVKDSDEAFLKWICGDG